MMPTVAGMMVKILMTITIQFLTVQTHVLEGMWDGLQLLRPTLIQTAAKTPEKMSMMTMTVCSIQTIYARSRFLTGFLNQGRTTMPMDAKTMLKILMTITMESLMKRIYAQRESLVGFPSLHLALITTKMAAMTRMKTMIGTMTGY